MSIRLGPGNSPKPALPSIAYLMALTQFAIPFMYSGVGVTLPTLGVELAASGVALGLVESVYLAGGAAFLLPLGCVAQHSDKRTLFRIGLLIYACATAVIGFLPSTSAIISVRLVQGIASAFMGATVMAILFEATPAGLRGRAIGLSMGAVYCGVTAGPLAAGVITTQLGWRWVFFLTAIPLFGTFGALQWARLGPWKFSRPRLNWLSTGLVILAVMLVVAGSSIVGEQSLGYFLMLSGVGACAAFFAIEERSVQPMLRLSEIRSNSEYSRALASQFLVYSAGFAMAFLFSIHLQLVSGYTAQESGLLLALSPLCMALVAPISGRLSDRYPPQRLAGLGTVMVTSSLLLATRVSAGTSLTYLVVVLSLQGLGLGLFSSPNVSTILHSAGQHRVEIASALSAKMRSLGMLASMTVVMMLLSMHMGSGPIAQRGGDFVHERLFSYLNVVEWSFVVHAGLGLFATLMIFWHAGKSSRPHA